MAISACRSSGYGLRVSPLRNDASYDGAFPSWGNVDYVQVSFLTACRISALDKPLVLHVPGIFPVGHSPHTSKIHSDTAEGQD